MAHEIDMSNGQANIAYVGETPWHGLGQQLDKDASLDVWAKAAGLDFTLAGVSCVNGDVELPGHQIIYRKDTNAGLSVVSNKYQVVQPLEVLDFFKQYVGGFATLETAGVLHGGRRYWAMARLDGEINVAGDISHQYLMLASSCDGSLATQARMTSVRVVCNNTLEMAQRGKADVSVRHNQVFDAQLAGEKLNGMYDSLAQHTEMLKALAGIKISSQQAEEFLSKMFMQSATKLGRTPARILELFNGAGIGAELESSKGTAYGLLQASTQFFDWEASRSQDNRVLSSWFGAGAAKKMNIADELLLLAA